jgi:hypothetical protein
VPRLKVHIVWMYRSIEGMERKLNPVMSQQSREKVVWQRNELKSQSELILKARSE